VALVPEPVSPPRPGLLLEEPKRAADSSSKGRFVMTRWMPWTVGPFPAWWLQ
jgi:hypothetical protein